MDEFTLVRLTQLVGNHKKAHGRDISLSELEKSGFKTADVDAAVRRGVLTKYQITSGKGSVENRYKLATDWRTLKA